MEIEYSGQEFKQCDATYGEWSVNTNGDLWRGNYFIDGDRLLEKNWMIHMMEKSWINMNDFVPAYFHALRNRGYEEITQLVYYNSSYPNNKPKKK